MAFFSTCGEKNEETAGVDFKGNICELIVHKWIKLAMKKLVTIPTLGSTYFIFRLSEVFSPTNPKKTHKILFSIHLNSTNHFIYLLPCFVKHFHKTNDTESNIAQTEDSFLYPCGPHVREAIILQIIYINTSQLQMINKT